MTTLEKIRAELHATAEMHNDGDYYLRDKWVDEIIDKYADQEPTDEWQDGYDMAWAEAEVFYEQEPCDDVVSREDVLAEITRFSTEEGASVECQQLYCDVNNMPSVRPQEPTIPCDLCRFNPPSSADGKPCTMCPAEKGGE